MNFFYPVHQPHRTKWFGVPSLMLSKKPSVEVRGEGLEESMDLEELTALLIRYFGHKEGIFDLAVEFQIGMGAAGPSKEHSVPSAIVGIAGVGLKRVEKPGPRSIDARTIALPEEPST